MNQLTEKDREIIHALKGDRAAYRSVLKDLMKRNRGKVIAYICQRGGTEEDAKDYFQEGVIALMQNVRAGKFQGGSTIDTYLFAICKQIFVHHIGRKRSTVSTEKIMEPTDAGAQAIQFSQSSVSEDRKLFFRKLIKQLDTICRQFFEDMALGFSLEVYAGREGVNYQTAKNRSSKCQQRLKELILQPHIQNRIKEL